VCQRKILEVIMKEGIHPKYFAVVATCVCGGEVELGSTQQAIRVEICSACHPFYTGQQKIVDTEGRVDRFVKRYSKAKKEEANV
jgi:large subunit ribosomal protein L31